MPARPLPPQASIDWSTIWVPPPPTNRERNYAPPPPSAPAAQPTPQPPKEKPPAAGQSIGEKFAREHGGQTPFEYYGTPSGGGYPVTQAFLTTVGTPGGAQALASKTAEIIKQEGITGTKPLLPTQAQKLSFEMGKIYEKFAPSVQANLAGQRVQEYKQQAIASSLIGEFLQKGFIVQKKSGEFEVTKRGEVAVQNLGGWENFSKRAYGTGVVDIDVGAKGFREGEKIEFYRKTPPPKIVEGPAPSSGGGFIEEAMIGKTPAEIENQIFPIKVRTKETVEYPYVNLGEEALGKFRIRVSEKPVKETFKTPPYTEISGFIESREQLPYEPGGMPIIGPIGKFFREEYKKDVQARPALGVTGAILGGAEETIYEISLPVVKIGLAAAWLGTRPKESGKGVAIEVSPELKASMLYLPKKGVSYEKESESRIKAAQDIGINIAMLAGTAYTAGKLGRVAPYAFSAVSGAEKYFSTGNIEKGLAKGAGSLLVFKYVPEFTKELAKKTFVVTKGKISILPYKLVEAGVEEQRTRGAEIKTISEQFVRPIEKELSSTRMERKMMESTSSFFREEPPKRLEYLKKRESALESSLKTFTADYYKEELPHIKEYIKTPTILRVEIPGFKPGAGEKLSRTVLPRSIEIKMPQFEVGRFFSTGLLKGSEMLWKTKFGYLGEIPRQVPRGAIPEAFYGEPKSYTFETFKASLDEMVSGRIAKEYRLRYGPRDVAGQFIAGLKSIGKETVYTGFRTPFEIFPKKGYFRMETKFVPKFEAKIAPAVKPSTGVSYKTFVQPSYKISTPPSYKTSMKIEPLTFTKPSITVKPKERVRQKTSQDITHHLKEQTRLWQREMIRQDVIQEMQQQARMELGLKPKMLMGLRTSLALRPKLIVAPKMATATKLKTKLDLGFRNVVFPRTKKGKKKTKETGKEVIPFTYKPSAFASFFGIKGRPKIRGGILAAWQFRGL